MLQNYWDNFLQMEEFYKISIMVYIIRSLLWRNIFKFIGIF